MHILNTLLVAHEMCSVVILRGVPKFLNPVCAARASCTMRFIYMRLHGRRARAIFRVSYGSGTVPSHGTATSEMIDRSPSVPLSKIDAYWHIKPAKIDPRIEDALRVTRVILDIAIVSSDR